jgi:hypothetical protein
MKQNFFEKLIFAQLINKLPAFCGTETLITVFTEPYPKPDESSPHAYTTLSHPVS